jgi:hypothetical protein
LRSTVPTAAVCWACAGATRCSAAPRKRPKILRSLEGRGVSFSIAASSSRGVFCL